MREEERRKDWIVRRTGRGGGEEERVVKVNFVLNEREGRREIEIPCVFVQLSNNGDV